MIDTGIESGRLHQIKALDRIPFCSSGGRARHCVRGRWFESIRKISYFLGNNMLKICCKCECLITDESLGAILNQYLYEFGRVLDGIKLYLCKKCK